MYGPTTPGCTAHQHMILLTSRNEEPPKRSQADKRIDFLLKKHFNDAPDYRPLILELAALDPTPKKKYLAWLVKHWTAQWKPTDAERERVAKHLETHHKGAKYFSPLSWTGLRLEDAGYQADIFRYTPETLGTLGGSIAEMIRVDEEDKQIRKGNLVVTGGAEVAYKDECWTLLRVRTNDALRRLGQGTSWCVRHGTKNGYRFPFDFLLNNEGERFLANGCAIRDRWNKTPPPKLYEEIDRIRKLGSDGYDRAFFNVKEAIKSKQRHNPEVENQLMQYPDLAVQYAEKVICGKWPEFESVVRVAALRAEYATDYAIKCRCERWPRFENKIKRSPSALWRYRKAFPGSIPETYEEIFEEKLTEWRGRIAGVRKPIIHWSVGWQAESRERDVRFEDCLLLNYAEASIYRYARLVASLATSPIGYAYQSKILSYFTETDDKQTQIVNEELGPLILERLRQRIPEIEPLIAGNSENAFAYAKGIGQPFPTAR